MKAELPRKPRAQWSRKEASDLILLKAGKSLDVRERFMADVHKLPGFGLRCWLWTGTMNSNGYGQFNLPGRTVNAHHASYLLFKGDVPKDYHVCHACDIYPCVRPEHLWLGTRSDNIRDCFNKGRLRTPFLDKAKLTDAQVAELRAMKTTGLYKHREIAEHFGVSCTQVTNIVNFKARVKPTGFILHLGG